ncbi:hypothetical protein HN446_01110 [bacterium]|jgi:hypothetical protein|nr:hypothetical protein [bacterium]
MKRLTLVKSKSGIYMPVTTKKASEMLVKIENATLGLIYTFLERDGVILVPNLILDWVDSDEDWMGTNVCFLKKEGDKIVLGRDNDEDEDFLFSTSRNNFITMVKKWLEVIKMEPKKITISLYDDGRVEIKPID